MFGAELLFAFIWFLKQPFYWWPVTRTVFPERLPKDDVLPAIDVFLCTTDPKKEPTFEVMNTVISAMSLDYPADKLSIYLSDDGAASVTLYGIKEAWVFATWWLPFCKKYNVKTVCPRAYFKQPEPVHEPESMEASRRSEFIDDRNIVQDKYEVFKSRVQSKSGTGEIDGGFKTSAQDHSSFVQLRVSAMFSNSHYILVLDCDMYCNDSKSARQAMCFYLDPKISPTLGWVQYPQTYYNVNENDIYDSRMRFL
ncbi:hypothetical protein BVRB_1g023090 isoform A [Beta vulgaris subsp. vulgaris]|nr:hypothetical protein BVRB_1g023090 isoform A [Beta vulgaris subsp. vulgaris]